jgi:5-formyltetrahydrofolate cyclo-ligase
LSAPNPAMKTVPDQKSRKDLLRKELRRERVNLEPRRRESCDAAINAHLIDKVQKENYRVVAAFLAFDGEPDLQPSLQTLSRKGVRLALPVIHEAPGRDYITFQEWAPGRPLKPNRFDILEPQDRKEVPLPEIDLALIPLVGWDRSGARLGMGASFYDRALQPFSQLLKPVRAGVAYRSQEASEIPMDPWDIRLHAVLTEDGWFTCSG